MKLKRLLPLIGLLTLMAGCGRPWLGKNEEVIMLPNVHAVKGGHCESAAILNAMLYLGYPVNEAVIAGGGAAMGFMFQPGVFPFLGCRSMDMRKTFFSGAGIKWRTVSATNPADSWAEVKKTLRRGIPVVLRVDMRYLPYRYNGRYGPGYTSFGGHYVTLFGLDTGKGTAYVTDREFEGLQEIKLADLDKARYSRTRVFPPGGEAYWVEPPPKDYRIDWDRLTTLAIKKIAANMENPAPNTGLNGLRELSQQIPRIEAGVKPGFLLPNVFHSLYGYIEEFGTGGAGFRIFVRDFLREASQTMGTDRFDPAIAALDESIASWHNLAQEFKGISIKIKTVKDPSQRAALYRRAGSQADLLYQREARLSKVLKELVEKEH